ncbi:hypothetical protein CFC21_020029 [Triticum aestivum]|uniref:Uncharacterized protein n=2 Tax=Triticum aestivum TaxID=4565 RepID=A0A9R1E6Q0_WHEAT|nr:uncharacterized protein LOC123186565 [Triticum aestivum]KAF7004858.1 hypothetical protein CFC21_020029 [Triticum aestivum]
MDGGLHGRHATHGQWLCGSVPLSPSTPGSPEMGDAGASTFNPLLRRGANTSGPCDGKEDAMSGQMLKRGVKAMPTEDHIRGNPKKQLNLTEVLAEAVKCAQALKTDELITDTRFKEAFAKLINEVYPRLPESLQDQLLADFKLNILRRAQEKNTRPVELMDGEQKNFLGKKGVRTNTLWIIEKLVLLVGVCCFIYLMSFYVTGY